MKKRWLVRPAKHDDESDTGYQYRLAEANGYISLTRWKNANFTGNENSISSLSARTDDNRYTLTAHQRVCPSCMLESSYLRAAWDHALLPTCLTHKVTLETHCPECRHILRRAPGRINACMCLHAYSSISPRHSEPNALEYLLAQKLGHISSNARANDLPHLAHLSSKQLLNLICLMGTYENFSELKKPRKASLKEGSENAHKILTRANETLTSWPENFHALLRSTYSRYPSNSTLRSVFGYFYSAIYKDLSSEKFQFIRSAFEAWLKQEWKGQLTERHRRLQSATRARKNVRSITKICKETGVSHTLLAQLVARGEIRGCIRELPSGRVSTMIEIDQRAHINKLATRYDLLSASQRLAIPEYRLKLLLEANTISGVAPRKGGRWQIHLSEIDRIHGLVRKLKIVPGNTEDKYWTFNEALRFKLAESESFPEFFSAIFSGEIRSRRVPPAQQKGVAAILINKDSLMLWQQKRCPGISVQALAGRLNVKQEVVYHLVNASLIPTVNLGRLGSFVDIASIEAFESKYLWARDIAKASRTSPRKVITLLRDNGVGAVSGPETDGGRQYLYLRRDVQQSSLFGQFLE